MDSKIAKVFSEQGSDDLYNKIMHSSEGRRLAQKSHIEELYNNNMAYLDNDFHKQIKQDFLGRLWELNVAECLFKHKDITIKNNTTKNGPDFRCTHFN